MISVEIYSPELKARWDEVVLGSRNGTFLHLRDYMDYHSHRFSDMSLVAMRDGKPLAVLPACREGDTLFSHRGLTYGGWLMPLRHFDASTMLHVWNLMLDLLREHGIKHLIYKPVPHIYHRYPAEEDLYAAFRCGARIIQCNLSATIDLDEPLPFDRGNKSNVNVAVKNGVVVQESSDWNGYWQVLNALLVEKYGHQAVHSLQEIELLHSRFPHNIKLYTATAAGELLAGVVMYYCGGEVAHSQYIASTPHGRELKALPAIFDFLIKLATDDGYRYFDFGISTEQGGLYLNEGLSSQKCRMGGRGIVYFSYEIKLDN
ncbi:MAG: GNAT family N-acetyltransferase [Muribaculaceae bacterium]|nr:GNAT family N-acetyltransferase [Muribaculaceae bacterium]